MHDVPSYGPGGLRGSRSGARLFAAVALTALTLGLSACTSDPAAGGGTGTTSASTSADAPITQATYNTPIPAPAGNGDIAETVAPRSETTQAPVDLTDAVELTGGLVVTVPSIIATEAEAVGPGEIGGAAVAVEVAVQNNTDQSVPLDGFTLTLIDSLGQVAPMTTTGELVSPLTGTLDPGAAVTGSYVFTLAESARSTVTITVSDAASATSVVFTGSAA